MQLIPTQIITFNVDLDEYIWRDITPARSSDAGTLKLSLSGVAKVIYTYDDQPDFAKAADVTVRRLPD